MKLIYLIFLLSICFSSRQVFAQGGNQPKQLNSVKIEKDLTIDGSLNEPEWQQAPVATGFWQNFPADTSLATGRTEVKVLYNDKYLYIAAHVYNTKHVKQYVTSSLKRDFLFPVNDAFGVILDPFGDHIYGYGFYVSAYGVQREEQIYSGSTVDATWDIKWFCAVQRDDNGWTVEMAIPFRYLRYNQNLPAWNINFIRNNASSNELSSWVPTPRNFTFPNLSFAGTLSFPQPLKKTSDNISITPSITVNASQDARGPVTTTVKPSLNTKIAVSSSLNLDLTVNPDFSEAEVDQAQVNLTRFNISYPETRPFFIENSDLFSEFGENKLGSSPIRPFYSRSIGLQYNSTTGQYDQTPIIAGVRLSGKINKDLRIGVMSIQTGAVQDSATNNKRYPAQNYSVVALQQKVFSSSNIGLIFTNRQSFGTDSTKNFKYNSNDYNRLLGLEYNLTSRDGEWTGKLFEEMMFSPSTTASSQGGLLNYNSRRSVSWIGFTRAIRDFNPDMGFVPRNNFINPYSELSYVLYPKSSVINFWRPVVHYELYLDSAYHRTDHQYRIGTEVNFKNTGDMYVLFLGNYTKLRAPYNPALNNGKDLPADSAYTYNSMSFYYLSDLRRQISGLFFTETGQYYNGHFTQFFGYLNNKIQPLGTIGINYNIILIRLPHPYSSNNVYAVGPQATLSFSKNVFFDSNIQYTSENNNINFFFRLQWRFRPMSDLFIAYNSNQSTQPWQRQNRGLILKLTYLL